MKAIVHIGTEKTGTTSIQRYLYLNRKALKSAGFQFVQSAGKTNNRAFPAYCISEDRYDDFFRGEGIRTLADKKKWKRKFIKNFERELSSAPKSVHTFVMSSEHFHSRIRSEAEMDAVYKLLSTYFEDIRIVCYLREQVTTCTSYYSTHLKSGGTDSFQAFMQRCKPGNYYFNYYEMLGNWERCFGIQSLDISLFAQDRFLNGDLLDDFTAKISPALVGTLNKAIQTENESLKPIGQALGRAVNMIFPVASEAPQVKDMRDKCKKIITAALSGRGQQPGLPARKMMYESFIESNELLRSKFFADIETLFPPPVEVAAVDDAVAEAEFDVITDVLNLIRRHGQDAILPGEYANVFPAISSCIDDVSRVEVDTVEFGNKVILSDEDGELLRRASRRFEGRENSTALRLMTLASLASPQRESYKRKLAEYREKEGHPPKPLFFLSYHLGDKVSSSDEAEVSARLGKWLQLRSAPVGYLFVGVDDTRVLGANDDVTDVDNLRMQAFSIVEFESLEEAVSVANECPYLELGGTVRVSELAPLLVFSAY